MGGKDADYTKKPDTSSTSTDPQALDYNVDRNQKLKELKLKYQQVEMKYLEYRYRSEWAKGEYNIQAHLADVELQHLCKARIEYLSFLNNVSNPLKESWEVK